MCTVLRARKPVSGPPVKLLGDTADAQVKLSPERRRQGELGMGADVGKVFSVAQETRTRLTGGGGGEVSRRRKGGQSADGRRLQTHVPAFVELGKQRPPGGPASGRLCRPWACA